MCVREVQSHNISKALLPETEWLSKRHKATTHTQSNNNNLSQLDELRRMQAVTNKPVNTWVM